MIDILEQEEQRILNNLETLLTRSSETVSRVEKTKTELEEVSGRVQALRSEENTLLLHIADAKTELSAVQNLLEQRRNELALYNDLQKENITLKTENEQIQAETRDVLRDISLIKLQYSAHVQEVATAKISYEENRLAYTDLENKLAIARDEEKLSNGYYIGQLQALLDKNHIKFDVIKNLK